LQSLEKRQQLQSELHKSQTELTQLHFECTTSRDEVSELRSSLADSKAQLDRLRHVEGDHERAQAKATVSEKALAELQAGDVAWRDDRDVAWRDVARRDDRGVAWRGVA
jgi:septal ring factor EnvC (AmiA/AmiB activator)